MRFEKRLAIAEEEVSEIIELTRSCNGRIKRPQRPCSRIPGIGKLAQAGEFALIIQPLERSALHHGFPAHFKGTVHRVGPNPKRERADCLRIFGDVFADSSVASGERLTKTPVVVLRGHGKSVELQFGDVLEVFRL